MTTISAEVGRLVRRRRVWSRAGATRNRWRPVRRRARAGLPLPTGAELVDLVVGVDRPGRLILVEGAGGLLVEIGADGVTLRDLAARPGRRRSSSSSRPGLGTLNHAALTVEALAAQIDSVRRPGDRRLAAGPGPAESSNRGGARAASHRCARCCPTGAGALTASDVRGAQRGAFDDRLGAESVDDMAHSVELLFDPDTEASIRRTGTALADAGLPSQAHAPVADQPPARHADRGRAHRRRPSTRLCGSRGATLPLRLPDRRTAGVRPADADAGAADRARRGTAALAASRVDAICAPTCRPARSRTPARAVDAARHAVPTAGPDRPRRRAGVDRRRRRRRHLRRATTLGRRRQGRHPDRLTAPRDVPAMPSTSRCSPKAKRPLGFVVITDCPSGSAPAASHCRRDCSSAVKPST